MQLEIKINMDNESFEDFNTGEVSNILRAYIKKICKGGCLMEGDKETLMDSNGNSVGVAIVK